jgi:hypothetical protein
VNEVTILVSTSSIISHPDTAIIDQTIASVRATLPNSAVIIMADGLKPEHRTPERMAAYAEYKERLRGRYENSTLLEYEENVNQAGMLGRALELVQTPLLCYLEHDWKLSPNVEWEALGKIILSGRANYIKFHAGCRIHPLHWGMMIDHVIWDDIPLFRTVQWSQNPHLASTDFYRKIHGERLVGRRDCIENIMHSECACYLHNWDAYKLCIYDPMHEGTMQMITHLDGREGER